MAPATVGVGAHRDPRDPTVVLRRLVTAPRVHRLVPVAEVRRVLTSPAVRGLLGDPRFALMAALLATMVLVTGKAHDELTGTAGRLPTASSVVEAERAESGGRIAADPPATKPREPAPAEGPADISATRTPAATPIRDTPPGAGKVGPAPSDPRGGRPDEAAEAPVERSSNAGPAGSVRRTGGTGVALTFDDGPDPVNTPRLLDLLQRQGVKATFCVVGVRALAHPDLVRRMAADGHTLCNHSWNHGFDLGSQPEEKIREDLERTNAAIRAAVPDASIRYFRAPGGFFTPRLVSVARSFEMTSLHWEVDPRDWDQPALETDEQHVERIVRIVERETRPGSMVLSHDFQQPMTIAAYEKLVPWLKQRFDLIPLPTS